MGLRAWADVLLLNRCHMNSVSLPRLLQVLLFCVSAVSVTVIVLGPKGVQCSRWMSSLVDVWDITGADKSSERILLAYMKILTSAEDEMLVL